MIRVLGAAGAVDLSDVAGDATVLVVAGEADDGPAAVTELHAALRDRPRRLVVLDLGGEGDAAAVRSAILATAVRYATGALFHEAVSVNCVRPAVPEALPAALAAVGAVATGRLDAVRGQTLVVYP